MVALNNEGNVVEKLWYESDSIVAKMCDNGILYLDDYVCSYNFIHFH